MRLARRRVRPIRGGRHRTTGQGRHAEDCSDAERFECGARPVGRSRRRIRAARGRAPCDKTEGATTFLSLAARSRPVSFAFFTRFPVTRPACKLNVSGHREPTCDTSFGRRVSRPPRGVCVADGAERHWVGQCDDIVIAPAGDAGCDEPLVRATGADARQPETGHRCDLQRHAVPTRRSVVDGPQPSLGGSRPQHCPVGRPVVQ